MDTFWPWCYLSEHSAISFLHPSHQYPDPKASVTFLLQVLQAQYHMFWSGLMWLIRAFVLKKTGCKMNRNQNEPITKLQSHSDLGKHSICTLSWLKVGSQVMWDRNTRSEYMDLEPPDRETLAPTGAIEIHLPSESYLFGKIRTWVLFLRKLFRFEKKEYSKQFVNLINHCIPIFSQLVRRIFHLNRIRYGWFFSGYHLWLSTFWSNMRICFKFVGQSDIIWSVKTILLFWSKHQFCLYLLPTWSSWEGRLVFSLHLEIQGRLDSCLLMIRFSVAWDLTILL